jgi:hypothetical protein
MDLGLVGTIRAGADCRLLFAHGKRILSLPVRSMLSLCLLRSECDASKLAWNVPSAMIWGWVGQNPAIILDNTATNAG